MKHAVVLDVKRCRGCTTCIKNCPTEAIRVRRGKAIILPDRCIDCGRCIQVCPHRAIRSVSDALDRLREFRYCVAVPEPALYGQFHHLKQVDQVLNGLLKVGFHKVFEAAKAAEILTEYVARRTEGSPAQAPLISPHCPAILRLIRIRFPRLIPHLDPLVMPMEPAATLARREACAETGLPPEEIGVFAIVPCPAKVTAAHNPEGLTAPVLDGALSIRDVYLHLLHPMEELPPEKLLPMSAAGATGVGVAVSGGTSRARQAGRYVAVDGIENCIQMLEEIEDNRQPEVDFIELSACTQGCVGGCLTVENPYAARMRLERIMGEMPPVAWPAQPEEMDQEIVTFSRTPQYSPAFRLDPDRAEAMAKHLRIEALEATLPGLHCGSCGAPNCHAFAEDVILGRASADDCIFKVRERMRDMAGPAGDEYLPPPFRQKTPQTKNK